MTVDLIARASTTIDAPLTAVWDALVNPEIIRRYMFGAEVTSSWKTGSPIVWKGEWEGKPYEDKGVILDVDPEHRLEYTHFSPLAGKPDKPENYHTVSIELTRGDGGVEVTITQDNNPTEEAREHSERNWSMMLDGLKKVVEG